MRYKNSSSKKSKIGWKLPLAVLVAVALVIAGLELTNKTYIFHDKEAPATIPSTKPSQTKKKGGETVTNDEPPASTSSDTPKPAPPSTNPKAYTQAGTSDPDAPLVAPYGNFVSNHFPGKNGSPSKEESLCSSTPGASCYIEFKNTGTGEVSKLESQTIGSNGSTSWSWDAKILPNGKWQITAVVVRGGETKRTSDPLLLEVSL